MKGKWLLVSSVSTSLGIVAGAVYLFFAEHSLLLSNQSWVMSAFWSTVVLWTFVLMFVVALLFNILAFFELEEQQVWRQWIKPVRFFAPNAEKQQQFLQQAQQYLSYQGSLSPVSSINGDYQCLQAEKRTLVYVQPAKQQVEIAQIRSLFQQMLAADFSQGLVVSYAGFSNQAKIFAQEANIELLDVKTLRRQQKKIQQQQFAIV